MQSLELQVRKAEYHETLLARTKQAIENLAQAGKSPSFYAVAKEACVARSTLYRCDDLRELVLQARSNSFEPHAVSSSLQANTQIQQLKDEVALLRRERELLLHKIAAMQPQNCYTYAIVSFANLYAKTDVAA